MKKLFRIAGSFLDNIAGSFSWTPPPWAAALRRMHKDKPRRFWSCWAVTLLLFAVVAGGYGYYRHMPRPLRLTAEIEAPGISPDVEDPRPDPLRVTFTYDLEHLRSEQTVPDSPPSVARLDLVNQRIESGIRLEPAMDGTWRWEGDRTLVFVPDREWPAGTRFRLRFDKRLFTPEARFSGLNYTFESPPFSVALTDLAFYQDPQNRQVRKAVTTLKFSHPVDPGSLEKHLGMQMRPSDPGLKTPPEPIDFSITYDKNRRKAYVHSAPLELPEHSNFLTLTIDRGIRPATGGNASDQRLSKQLLIPDRFSFLKVESTSAAIVRNQKKEPGQVLTLRFTDDIAEAELKAKLQIWLLPDKNPHRNSTYWRSPAEVTDEVLRLATPLERTPLETEHGFAREFHLPLDVPPGRTLYVRLQPGLTSLGHFVHKSFYAALIKAPDYPKEIKIAADGSLLSLAGTHRLGLMTRGLEAFQVRIGKLLPGQLQHLISQTRGDLRDPDFAGYRFDQDNIVEYAEQVVALKPLSPKQANYASVDLSSYLPGGKDRCGAFFVEVTGWDTTHRRRLHRVKDRRLILITDLGLLVKNNADESHGIFVQSLVNGRPVSGARVTLQGRNGLPLLSRTTDAQGYAAFPVTKGFENEQEPTVYVVKTADDMAFIPFERPARQLNFSRFETGGEYTDQGNGKTLHAFLFSDRGLYRPGEKVAIGCIVKSRPLGNIEGIPLELAIRGPRGNEVAGTRLSLPVKGFFDYPYATQATAETGTYRVSLYLVRDNKYRGRMIGSADFRVEEFQPDTLKIESTLPGVGEKGWSTARQLTAQVRLRNLFGTPAAGRKVTAFMNVRSSRFNFSEYTGYTFADPWYDPDKPPLQINEELKPRTSDTRGQAEFTLPLERFSAGTYLLTLTTGGFKPGGGRSVTARNSVLLSPLETLVGTKTDGSLDYINKDTERHIDLIAVGKDLETRELRGLRARIMEIRTISTLVKQPNGTYAYRSVEKERERHTQDLAIAAGGSRYRLPTDRPGTYVLEILDREDLKLARVRFNVVGHGNLAGQLEKNAELDLKLNRKDYKAGETIEMHITAPYTGSGLISIESDRVHAWKWFRTDTTATLQTIVIPENLEGNAYVNVAFVRDAASREIFTAPLSYAVAPFTIDRGKRTLGVNLNAPPGVRPGERMEITYSASRPSRIAVFAVNEGILQVAGYTTPQPLDHFLRKRALQVDTLQMLDLILPEFDLIREVSASGGGMADESMRKALAANLNPFARALDKPAVFWSGIIDADKQQRTVGFTVPDTFSGTLRVMAVAVAEEAIGVAEQSTLVRGPFVITPGVLTSAAPGDSFRVSAGISNILEGSGKDAPVHLRLETSPNLEIVGEQEKRLAIDEGGEKTVYFRLRAKGKPGAAQVRYIVTSGKEQATRGATLSIRPALPYTTTMTSGYTEDGKAQLKLSRSLYPDLAEQYVAASASPLVLIDGLSSYLEHFPHGCTEQVVSQVFPLVGLMSHPAFAPHAADNKKRFDTLIARLRERQMANGGFCFWPGGSEVAEFPTVYAMHFLLEVQELGYTVPADLMTRGQDYLRNYAGEIPADMEQARVRAYAAYLLTRMGEVVTNHLVSLQTWLDKNHPKTWRQDLTAAYMAAAYGLLQKRDDAAALISHYRMGAGGSEGDGVFHSPLTRDAQYVYLLAKHFPGRAAKLDGGELLRFVEPVFRGRYNTISAAYTILALGAYGRLRDTPLRDEAIRMTAVDGRGQKRALPVRAAPLPQAPFPTGTDHVVLSAGTPLFHLLSQAGFDRDLPASPVRDKLEITRDYLDRDGKPVTRAEQGQEITVRLRVRSLGEPVSNVAVIDLLPGGFEVLRESVPRTVTGWRADYVDVREDRVIFYGRFDTAARELSYRAKVTAAGEFVIPPPFAGAMYDRAVRASGVAGKFSVTPAQPGKSDGNK